MSALGIITRLSRPKRRSPAQKSALVIGFVGAPERALSQHFFVQVEEV